MASFEQRGKKWQFTVSRYINGEYKPIRQGGFDTKKEAETIATEIEDKLNKRAVIHLKPISFGDYFEEWLSVYKTHIAKNTKDRYLNTLNSIRAYFKGEHIQDIKKRQYQLFINDYGKTRHKNSTIKLNSQIRACVLDAIDEGVIYHDFTRNVRLTGKEATKEGEKHLDEYANDKLVKYLELKLNQMISEREIFKNQIDLRYFILWVCITTGLRYGEVVALRPKSVESLSDKRLKVTNTWGYTKSMSRGFNPTKNKKRRIIKIGDNTFNYFEQLQSIMIPNEYDLFFYDPRSRYKVVGNTGVNSLLKTILQKLNIEESISVHGLRHTHASILLYRGVSVQYVSERLGHSNVETTYRYYSHVINEQRKEEEEKTIKIYN